ANSLTVTPFSLAIFQRESPDWTVTMRGRKVAVARWAPEIVAGGWETRGGAAERTGAEAGAARPRPETMGRRAPGTYRRVPATGWTLAASRFSRATTAALTP